MKKISLIILGIFLINSVSAVIICVDKTLPSAPSNLVLTASGNNIQLNWEPATDEPSCSGIDYYNIFKNNNFLISIEETNYLNEDLDYGTYIYTIYAVDLVGHNEGMGISTTITISAPGENGETPSSGGGGGGNNDVSYWQCGEWGVCINEIQTRTCVNFGENLPDRTETKECSVGFVPLGYENNETETDSDEIQESSSTNFLTGAVTGVTDFVKSGRGMVTIIFLIALGGVFVGVRAIRRRISE